MVGVHELHICTLGERVVNYVLSVPKCFRFLANPRTFSILI